MKQTILIALVILMFGFTSKAQNTEYVYNQNEVHFYGLDFSHAHMIGEDFDRGDKIVEHYFRSWNDLLFVEKNKYNVEEFFDFKRAHYHTQYLLKTNLAVDPYELRINGSYKMERAKLFESVRAYDFPEKEGLGIDPVQVGNCVHQSLGVGEVGGRIPHLRLEQKLRERRDAGTLYSLFVDARTVEAPRGPGR